MQKRSQLICMMSDVESDVRGQFGYNCGQKECLINLLMAKRREGITERNEKEVQSSLECDDVHSEFLPLSSFSLLHQ